MPLKGVIDVGPRLPHHVALGLHDHCQMSLSLLSAELRILMMLPFYKGCTLSQPCRWLGASMRRDISQFFQGKSSEFA